MPTELRDILKKRPLTASAPCRIDMGGTLDISTFHLPLRHYRPCTVNVALNLRTHVRLLPYTEGMVKISSHGFKSAEYPLKKVPFTHPMGLMFAVAAYFGQAGIEVNIRSTSPPRSGLGGSSAAAVALIGAYVEGLADRSVNRKDIAHLAHALEGSVAGVACGIQDQLAAAYGGVHLWQWMGDGRDSFKRKALIRKKDQRRFEKHLLIAYCGIPHESKQVNQKWGVQFMAGKFRDQWIEMIHCTKTFADAVAGADIKAAVKWMNRETELRRKMTPEVLDGMGRRLVKAAVAKGCGARFTGAGGGGCVWALGEVRDIDQLRDTWSRILSKHPDATLLESNIDSEGLVVHTE